MSLRFGDPAGPSQALESGIRRVVTVLKGRVRSTASPEPLPATSNYKVEVFSHFRSRESEEEFRVLVTKGDYSSEEIKSSIEAALSEARVMIEELKVF